MTACKLKNFEQVTTLKPQECAKTQQNDDKCLKWLKLGHQQRIGDQPVKNRLTIKAQRKQYFADAPQMSVSSLSSLESGVGMPSDEESNDSKSSEADSEGEDREGEERGSPRFTHPFVRWPRKRRRRYQSYRSIIHQVRF